MTTDLRHTLFGSAFSSKLGLRTLRLFTLFVALPTVLLFMISEFYVTRELRIASRDELQRLCHTCANSVNDWLLLLERQVSEIAVRGMSADENGGSAAYGDTLRETLFSAIAVQDQGGTRVSGQAVDLPPLSAGDRDFLKSGKTLMKPFGEKWFAVIVMKGGRQVVAVPRRLSLRKLLLDRSVYWQTRAAVLDREGGVVASSQEDNTLFDSLPLPTGSSRKIHLNRTFRDKEFIGAARRIFLRGRFGMSRWNVVLLKPESLAFTSAHAFARTLYALMGISVIGMLLLAVSQVNRFTSHVATLRDATIRIGNRNYGHKVDIASGDEFELLATAFNSMASELQMKEEHLRRVQRVESIGVVASGVAHDLRNAMMPLTGYLNLLESKPELLDDREKLVDILAKTRAGAEVAVQIVGRLTEFYGEPGERQRSLVDVARVIQEAVDFTRPRWKEEMGAKGVSIRVEHEAEDLPPLLSDGFQLREVLANLIFNAVDAMPAGGTIRIHARAKDPWLYIEIEDDGIGMTADVKHRCLDLFFSTKGKGGTGLGLAVVQNIVGVHRGKMEIESAPGQGTVVVLRFPLRPDEKPLEKAHAEEGGAVGKLRVLTIDDDPGCIELVSEFLKENGHVVSSAPDGETGLRIYEEGEFDLVITDRAMPGINGEQVAAAIKETGRGTVVIMLTGFGGDLSEEDLESGIDLVVSKPITYEGLQDAIAKAMAFHEGPGLNAS